MEQAAGLGNTSSLFLHGKAKDKSHEGLEKKGLQNQNQNQNQYQKKNK